MGLLPGRGGALAGWTRSDERGDQGGHGGAGEVGVEEVVGG